LATSVAMIVVERTSASGNQTVAVASTPNSNAPGAVVVVVAVVVCAALSIQSASIFVVVVVSTNGGLVVHGRNDHGRLERMLEFSDFGNTTAAIGIGSTSRCGSIHSTAGSSRSLEGRGEPLGTVG